MTDDSAFIKYLQENNIRHMMPANLIVLIRKSNKIDVKTTLAYLEKLRWHIKDEVYEETRKDLKEED